MGVAEGAARLAWACCLLAGPGCTILFAPEPAEESAEVDAGSGAPSPAEPDAAPPPDAGAPASTNDAAPSPCPDGYTEFAESCYRAVSFATTWDQAKDDCADDDVPPPGAHLAIISSDTENVRVRNFFSGQATWIGGYGYWVNYAGLKYTWLNGESIDRDDPRWEADEPDGYCTEIRDTVKIAGWNATRCDFTRPFVCEYELEP